ncbi:MAG: ribosome biogenesis GTPase Der [Verrucomicrobia bacterium Tous-C9LFEB]|nr:MAG: ribosome biogenesis GTPase Der [Verrucomicrobia bacterium Tous-C9LFEB]
MNRTVAIVGRPNVGKSALFNRLTGKQISLVFDRPGTTRDRLVTTCRRGEHEFNLIDTGGIGLEDNEGFGEAIAHEAELALATASDILLVVDARQGLTPLDRDVAKRLRKANRPVLVVANKVDAPEKMADIESEFAALGFGNVFPVSAAHGHGIGELFEALTKDWPKPEPLQQNQPDATSTLRPVRIAIVGRPNVGKSSLINAIVSESRAIVSDVPGTTRDAVDVSYTWKDLPFTFIDTAGMRQERRIHDELEAAMSSRSAHAINRADIAVLVVDAVTGVSMQDKKIAGLIQDANCPCIVVVNKWDIARDQGDASKTRERAYYDTIHQDLFFVNYAPVLFVSAKSGERVEGLLKTVMQIEKNRHYQFATGPLNRVLIKAIQRQAPPEVSGKRFKIFYATQDPQEKTDRRVIPTLILFVNNPKLLTASYQRYLEIQLRDAFDIRGCPLRLVLRGRQPAPRGGVQKTFNGEPSPEKTENRPAHKPSRFPKERKSQKRKSGRRERR